MEVHIVSKFWIFFNPEVQVKDTESDQKNKLIDLFS